MGNKVKIERWHRWHRCGLCEQQHHGVVKCALGWACWKTYVGRLETDDVRRAAMTQLGNGLGAGKQYEDELTVREAELATLRRIGAPEVTLLAMQGNLANTYDELGRLEEALSMKRDVYFGFLKLKGEENEMTLIAANNYAWSLNRLENFEEAKALLRRTVPVARRVLGESCDTTLKMKKMYAIALGSDTGATLDDLREAVTTLEEAAKTAVRVLGGSHPFTGSLERSLKCSRATLRARETPSRSA